MQERYCINFDLSLSAFYSATIVLTLKLTAGRAQARVVVLCPCLCWQGSVCALWRQLQCITGDRGYALVVVSSCLQSSSSSTHHPRQYPHEIVCLSKYLCVLGHVSPLN